MKLPIYPIKSYSTSLAKAHHYNLRTRDNWYNIKVGDKEKTVSIQGQRYGKDVENTCSSIISDVILPDNAAENKNYGELGSSFNMDLWLGIQGRAGDGSYLKMKDGLPVSYTNWASTPTAGSPEMVVIDKVDGTWKPADDGDTDAEQKAPWAAKNTLCEKDILSCEKHWTLSKVGDSFKCTQVVDVDSGVNSPVKMYRHGSVSV